MIPRKLFEGQHVNKTATAVELRVDIELLSLSAYASHRLHKQQAKRISKEGILVVQASSHRSQLKNRQEALDRGYGRDRLLRELPEIY